MCMFAALAVPYRVCSSFHSESDTNTLTHTQSDTGTSTEGACADYAGQTDRQTAGRQADWLPGSHSHGEQQQQPK